MAHKCVPAWIISQRRCGLTNVVAAREDRQTQVWSVRVGQPILAAASSIVKLDT